MIDVVVVGWRPDSVKRCLDSIYRHSDGEGLVILVCNRQQLSEEIAKDYSSTVCIYPGTNIGWLKAANLGLSASISRYVVLMNDDVEIDTDDWLSKMSKAFVEKYPPSKSKGIACVGPWGGKGYQSRVPQNQGAKIVEPNLTLDGWGIGSFPLSFFCVMFSKAALDSIGLLDEQFSPGYGEDDDWLARAHLAGWRMAIQTDVQVKHEGGGYDGRRGEIQSNNLQLLRRKYEKVLDSTGDCGIIHNERIV